MKPIIKIYIRRHSVPGNGRWLREIEYQPVKVLATTGAWAMVRRAEHPRAMPFVVRVQDLTDYTPPFALNIRDTADLTDL